MILKDNDHSNSWELLFHCCQLTVSACAVFQPGRQGNFCCLEIQGHEKKDWTFDRMQLRQLG